MSIRENFERVRDRVAAAAVGAGRTPEEITIIGVTKTHGPETVIEAIKAGITDVGENRVQEFLSKVDDVGLDVRWHLIGHLQTNKVNKVIGRFAMIHSVDSFNLAEKISNAGEREGVVTDILLEVNTSGEKSKFGLVPDETMDISERVSGLPAVNLRGLMTVGPWVDDVAVLSKAFAGLRLLGEKIDAMKIDNISIEHLSMGMTDDFEIAVAEGATMVRPGRVIFGERGTF
ncbi:MAG: YggS family pyridoxal phosphate-dependent enzyme [Candidatus Krumholzibacteria bacterium]|nr:YggS family pyridoxal phosphate-dependent enzyme [Candidatus Krumholzibacteria bacterium]